MDELYWKNMNHIWSTESVVYVENTVGMPFNICSKYSGNAIQLSLPKSLRIRNNLLIKEYMKSSNHPIPKDKAIYIQFDIINKYH